MSRDVAVVGAGPGGLIAARWLLSQGFEPTIFERAPTLGGQWAGLEGRSGVWPNMHTNSSRTMTAFSDLEHETNLVYPSNREILDYLHRYAELFGLTERTRFGTQVELVRRNGAGWLVRHARGEESFGRIVVASGRFHAPAVPEVVTFADGHAEDFDGIVFGTGFTLSLPFLSRGIREVLNLDPVHMDADRYTFHPDLPGMAFVGMWDQSGGYFVPLELQARRIAYTWSGAIAPPGERGQRLAIDACRVQRGTPQKTQLDVVALTFARAAGVEPHLDNWPDIRRALLFGPLTPSCFRLEGLDALPDAPARFIREAATFGAIVSSELTERERRYWSAVQAAEKGRR